MTDQFLNDMYIIAVKSKLLRNVISTEEKLRVILEELNSESSQVVVSSRDTNSTPVDSEQSKEFIQETFKVEHKAPIVAKDNLEVINIKYAQCPDEEGFLNRDLETSDDAQYYVIEMTSNPQIAYYSLITNRRTSRELMQTPQFAPNFAVDFENNYNKDQENLSMVKKGVLQKDGRFWKIVERCKAKWI